MAGAAALKSTYAAVLAVIMFLSAVFAVAEEIGAEAPSPSPLTGAASMAIVPWLAAGLVGSIMAFSALFSE